ncbi:lung seven transmembrane receptor family protein [Actinidia rufa]|uniref:Lung seven transmembrane receptor family protein n=1 Tax=Actinidia rufa TaxID=165716 RepID=A0A7J0EDC0_9ERIC|nr:lung seven transmembrane receptor family protein [Actinidia rufa]
MISIELAPGHIGVKPWGSSLIRDMGAYLGIKPKLPIHRVEVWVNHIPEKERGRQTHGYINQWKNCLEKPRRLPTWKMAPDDILRLHVSSLLVLGLIWFLRFGQYWKDIIQLHYHITAVIRLGMCEMAFWYFEFANFNDTGSRPSGQSPSVPSRRLSPDFFFWWESFASSNPGIGLMGLASSAGWNEQSSVKHIGRYAYLEDDIEEEDISPTSSGVDMAIKLERKERNASIATDQCVWARR